jgi:16S rRNA (adenine1518-N6/adenine1519-N6)-dimethyltransferase
VHRPKKSLGQNFLQDANISQKIVRLFNPQTSDSVVEIGPGKGALTGILLQTLPHLTVIELDDQLIAGLQVLFGDKITVIHNDILKVDLQSIVPNPGVKIRLIGNIPYNITTPILFHVIDSAAAVKDFVVMMQTEVAQRLTASPRTKEYGILSIFMQYYCNPKILFSVSKNSFFPIPDVSSTIVHLDFENSFEPKVENDALFRKIVRGTFNTRRKTLRNGLKNINIPHDEVEKIPIDLDQRPEELSVADFVKLSNDLVHLSSIILPNETEEHHG